jgi:hypothetical protein
MASPQPPSDKVELPGQPISQAEEDRLAKITSADITAAKVRAKKLPKLNQLLTARETNEGRDDPSS